MLVYLMILTEKNCFLLNLVQEFMEIETLLLLMFTQYIKLYPFHCHILNSADV